MKELDESLDNSWVVIRTSIETCLREDLAWVAELVDSVLINISNHLTLNGNSYNK